MLTMYDERTNLSRQVVEDIRSFFGEWAYSTVIPRNIRLGEAPSHGLSIFEYDPRSKGAEAYTLLSQEFLEREARASKPLQAETGVKETQNEATSTRTRAEFVDPKRAERTWEGDQ